MDARLRRLESLVNAIPSTVYTAGDVTAPTTSIPSAPFTDPSGVSDDGVPPSSAHVFPVTGLSTYFTCNPETQDVQHNPQTNLHGFYSQIQDPDQLAEAVSRMSLITSYLYYDDEGCTRWQGETLGFPILELLADHHVLARNRLTADRHSYPATSHLLGDKLVNESNLFFNRTMGPTGTNPHTMWKLTMSSIEPGLMDRCVSH